MAVNPLRLDNARYETKAELLIWQAQSKPGSSQHIAATVELGRRRDLTTRMWLCMGLVVMAMVLFFGTVLVRSLW